ncbi:MAG: prepilin-type N-terminal cleavage/methylation domain-containing protein [Solirubrobacteraceae bacterium]
MLNSGTAKVSSIGAQGGFTLIELVVAMACGLVVMVAATTVLVVTMQQSQRTFTRVDATRQARTALAKLDNELHSACVNGAPPIQGVTASGTVESDDNNLVFVSYYGTSDTPQAVWHDIAFDASARTLVDTVYSATYISSSTGSSWTASGTPTTTTLLSNVSQLPDGTPVFRYFAYKSYADSSGNLYWVVPDGANLDPLTGAQLPPLPLSTSGGLATADAHDAVEVNISMLVGPTSQNLNNTTLSATLGAPVTETISLRLTTPPDFIPAGSSASSYGPCQ